ncbi:MAG: triose-phosphate isomerase [Rhodospirillales bacterium]|nr:triose-phosphate isomerase [Rhodospirillales bacterium]
MSASSCLVVGNWKMHGTRAEATALVDGLKRLTGRGRQDAPGAEIVLCPPHTLLDLVGRQIRQTPFQLGAQDCSSAPPGPRTGEVAAGMLRDAGCTFVLLGHSERRAHHHESNKDVRAKVIAAKAAGLTPIVCVGESAAARTGGQAEAQVTAQVLASLPPELDCAAAVVAYEPVWSIGTGNVPGRAEIEAMHATIRGALEQTYGPGPWRILYGGSVQAANAGRIGGGIGVDGLLVGGASLQPGEFWGICEAVSPARTVLP